MTEQELHKKLSKAAFEWTMSSDSKSIADVVMPICKAYAADQVAAKDAEIAQLKTALEDKSLEYIGLHDFNRHLKAENERLREGVRAIHKRQQRLDGFELHHLALESLDIGGMLRTLIESFELSPAPVTEGTHEVRTELKELYATLSEKIELMEECHHSDHMEEMKAQIAAKLDKIGWDSPKNEDQNV